MNRDRVGLRNNWLILGLLSILIATLGTTVVLQTRELGTLRPAVRIWKQRAQWPVVGGTVPAFTGTRMDGSSQPLGPDSGHRELWFVITTSCPNCRAMIPVWKDMASRAMQDSSVVAYWLSLSPLDSTVRYVADHQLPPERVLLVSDKRAIRAARMPGVPLTLVIGTEGRVEAIHAGLLGPGLTLDSIMLAAREPRALEGSRTAPVPLPRGTP